MDGVPLVGPISPSSQLDRPPIIAEVFTHVVPNNAVALIEDNRQNTRLYTFNLCDSVDEYYQRDSDGCWTERNGIDDPDNQAIIQSMRCRLLMIFESDERWVAYAAFLRLIHADCFDEDMDMQKFVT